MGTSSTPFSLVVDALSGNRLAAIHDATREWCAETVVACLPALPRGTYDLVHGKTVLEEGVQFRDALPAVPQGGEPILLTAVIVDLPVDRKAKRVLRKVGKRGDEKAVSEELARLEAESKADLEAIAKVLLEEVLAHPTECARYAQVASALKDKIPTKTFAEHHGTFRHAVANRCQDIFECLFDDAPVMEQDGVATEGGEDALCAGATASFNRVPLVQFVGHLFLTGFLQQAVVAHIVHQLLGSSGGGADHGAVPEAHKMQCACELLWIAGPQMQATELGQLLLETFMAWLMELYQRTDIDHRSRVMIQNVLNADAYDWSD